jgi:predicted amidophosphoribosyltransferase
MLEGLMPSTSRCIICRMPIFKGLYCSDCQSELGRTRTADEVPLEQWLEQKRMRASVEGSTNTTIEDFFQIA